MEVVREEQLYLITSTERPKGPLTQNDTIIVFPRGCTYRSALENWLMSKGVRPKAVQEFRGVEAVLGCTAAGLGVTVLPRSVADQSRFPIRIIEMPTELQRVRAYWAYRKEAAEIPSIRAITEIVRRTAASPQ
jgi:DNA-binding transcriptional LysR family regulator